MKNPSDYAGNRPYDSIFQNAETETIIKNILVILERTGDIWRALSWEEYETERLKDGNFTGTEKAYFDKVIDYIHPERICVISPKYKRIWKGEKA
jgi:hypothetical protein